MATKEKLLSLLEENPGTYLSGEEIAGRLGVSRAAVCKAARALRDHGCAIHAVTNRGYCLLEETDLLSGEKIAENLQSPLWQVKTFSALPSTNTLLRDLAAQGAPEGTVILADSQSAGRGRMGRTFFSPEGTGLYMSLLLRPRNFAPAQSLQITTMAASALCLAIEEVTGKKPGIKWVNDLYLGGRKICGILTEASFSMETGMVEYAVLGLGLNVYAPKEGFPDDLKEIAGTLCERPEAQLKNRLAAAFLNRFSDFYQGKKFAEAAAVYRDRSLLTGKTILAGGRQAKVQSINDRCQLVVRYEDGETAELSYGEVSIVNSSLI